MKTTLTVDNLNVMMVAVESLQPNPNNRPVVTKEAAFKDMVASVKAVGIIQPILIRKDGDGWMIVAGHRRTVAAVAAGLKEIPAIVIEADSDQAIELAMIENLQRVNLTALQEMAAFGELTARGKTVDAIAVEIGKSVEYVYKRLILAKLIPAWQKALNEHRVAVGHAVIAARMTPEQQAQVLKRSVVPGGVVQMSVRQMWEFVQHEFHCDLVKAPFDQGDPALVPSAGTCLACPKRTGAAPKLFPEITKGEQCTDGACYRMKVAAVVQKALAYAKTNHPKDDVALLAEDFDLAYKTALQTWDYKIVKDGERVGVVCSGKDAGKVVRFDPVDHTVSGSAERTTETRKAVAKAKKIQLVKNAVFVRVVDALGVSALHDPEIAQAVGDVVIAGYRFDNYRAIGKALHLDRERKKGAAFDYEKRVMDFLKGKDAKTRTVIAAIAVGVEKGSWKYGKLTVLEDVAKCVGIDPAKVAAEIEAETKKTPRKAPAGSKKKDKNVVVVKEGKTTKAGKKLLKKGGK